MKSFSLFFSFVTHLVIEFPHSIVIKAAQSQLAALSVGTVLV